MVRAHRGLGRTFQITRLFGDMTVLENVVAPQRSFSWSQLGHIAVSGREARDAEELLQFVGMRDFRDQPARALSYGQKKLVEPAQILMLDPKLILLDEPAGGINPVLIERMAAMIRELNSLGKTFLVVEHNMPFVLDLCPRVHVLSRGSTMASGTSKEIQANPAVIDAYLGATTSTSSPRGRCDADVAWRGGGLRRRRRPAGRRHRRRRGRNRVHRRPQRRGQVHGPADNQRPVAAAGG